MTGVSGKTILITGGTGSFGNAVIARFLRTDIAQIRVLSRDEKKQEDMRLSIRDSRVRFYIGDVREASSIVDAMRGAHLVFHAAALKQVPSCEFHPMEAVRTNVLGAQNVLACAEETGVERMVVLSTDKAVYPINAMGISKAMMEKLAIAKARHLGEGGPILCITRYGNVMGSRGSVIPLFIDQLKRGVPITVTDPCMTRFLLSLEESVDLVLYACIHCQQGDILVQKAPASTIGDLAEALRRLFRRDNPISIIGTRHGEKLYETLIPREEMARAADLGGFYRIPYDDRDLNYATFFTEGKPGISAAEDYTSHNTRRLGADELVELLGGFDFVRHELGLPVTGF